MVFNTLTLDAFAVKTLELERITPWVTDLVDNMLRVSLMSLARQRRSIPKLLGTLAPYEGEEGWGALAPMAWWWSCWFVALGFQLQLYEPCEVPEAHLALETLASQNTPMHRLAGELKAEHLFLTRQRTGSPYDVHRREHRWGCLRSILSIEFDERLLQLDLATVTPNSPTTEQEEEGARPIAWKASDEVLAQIFRQYRSTLLPTIHDKDEV